MGQRCPRSVPRFRAHAWVATRFGNGRKYTWYIRGEEGGEYLNVVDVINQAGEQG